MLSSHTYNQQLSLSDASYYGSCSEFRESVLDHSDWINNCSVVCVSLIK